MAPWSFGRDFQLCPTAVNFGKMFSRIASDFLHFFLSFLKSTTGNLLTFSSFLPEVVFGFWMVLFKFCFVFPNPSVSL